MSFSRVKDYLKKNANRILLVSLVLNAVLIGAVTIGLMKNDTKDPLPVDNVIPTQGEDSNVIDIIDLDVPLGDVSFDDEEPYCSETVFDSVEAMANANIRLGMTVETRGYYYPEDGGASQYSISGAPEGSIDDIYTIQLSNGCYANLIIPEDEMINVASAGIMAESEISDLLNTLISSSMGKVKGIKFNNGKYYIAKPVFLNSLSYVGADNTVLQVADTFSTRDDKIFSTRRDGTTSYSLELININFLFEIKNGHPMQSKEIILVALQEIDGCLIDNCRFEAYPATSSGGYTPIDLLWFKHSSNISNIVIRNSVFENRSGEGYSGRVTDYLVGGCIWVCGSATEGSYNRINDILIENCNIYNTVSDEPIAMWGGEVSNVRIKNSSIGCGKHNSDNIIAFYNGSFDNIVIESCEFAIDSPSRKIIKCFALTGKSDFLVEGNDFYLNNGTAAYNTDSLLFVSSGTNDSDSCIEFRGNTVNMTAGVSYQAFLLAAGTKDKNIVCSDNVIEGNFSYGLLFFEDTDGMTLKCENNKIQTGTSIGNLKRAFNSQIIISGNLLKNKPTLTVNNAGTVDYELTNNTILKTGTVFNANRLAEDNGISHLTVADNKGADEDSPLLLWMYNSNNGVAQKKLLDIQEGR